MSCFGIALRRTGIGCVLVIWFSSNTVAADPIRVSSGRGVQGRASVETLDGDFETQFSDDSPRDLGPYNIDAGESTPPPDFELPVLAGFSVRQHTDVSATRWFGSGMADTFANVDRAEAQAESFMFVAFTLTEPMSYRFNGTISGAGGFSDVTLGGSTGLSWVFESFDAVPLVVMRRGLLSPGDYDFHVRADSLSNSFSAGTSAFDIQFTLTDPVPEPMTLFLFGTGAAIVGRGVWRRRRGTEKLGAHSPIPGVVLRSWPN